MDTVKTIGAVFWERFKIRTYPWDAGTDNGQWYADIDEDTDPPGNIVRMTVLNAPNGIFVNKDGNEIVYVAEWECILHTCPLEEPACMKENWPPKNGCDILQYPECAETCDPATTTPCELCNDKTYHKDCCLAGLKPSGGSCDGTAPTTSASFSVVMQIRAVSVLVLIGTVLALI
jgi:Spondin_N